MPELKQGALTTFRSFAFAISGGLFAYGVAGSTCAYAQGLVGKDEVEAVRVPGCDQPSLSVADRTECAARMKTAADDAERAEIRNRYEAMAQGNRIEGDGVPTESPPPEPQADAGPPAGAVTAPGTSGTGGPMGASDAAWLLTVAGGALVLGVALIYGVTRRRRAGPAAKAAQDRATNEAYGRGEKR